MFAIQNGLRSTSRLSGVIARNSNSIVSAPPAVKISTGEKLFAFGCIAGSILIWPMYFVPNFKNYAKPKGA
ncbi:hypothetical protein X777_15705 [Ooceraea biroi]|uniref:Uncharacterized protein n=1 Tax=Ooceraea biroi TaxID=2015173 RepID=A0A026WVD0_OOCBI|nr:hypothetical protein X777_15705 [Ooceraea biroi]